MKLGFYYHIPVSITADNEISMPAFLGMFIDTLAAEVDELVLVMHEGDASTQEYTLVSKNVSLINLGKVKPAYVRHFFALEFLKRTKNSLHRCDYLLVRGPSPLAPAFIHIFDPSRIVYLIVGSYKEGLKFLKLPWYKSWAIKKLNLLMHSSLQRATRGARILVNSELLLSDYRQHAKDIKLINTSTLTSSDFYIRTNACESPVLKLLYVGRLDFAKGLRECLFACADLIERGLDATLTLVGWEEKGTTVRDELLKLASTLKISEKVTFAGRKKAGIELLSYYRTHDVYLLLSFHEGFPRTIWEALANCIPVVSTKVGSIPFFLENGREALLVDSGDHKSAVEAIVKIFNDEHLRKHLVENGYERVKNVTMEIQSSQIINFINEKTTKTPSI